MTTHEPRPYSVPPLTTGLRLSALGRRTSASGSLAIVLSEMAFGPHRRDDIAALVACTASRVMEARS